jgi:hypothetical protein
MRAGDPAVFARTLSHGEAPVALDRFIVIVGHGKDAITRRENGSESSIFIGSKGGIGVLHRFPPIDENNEIFKGCRDPVFVSILLEGP